MILKVNYVKTVAIIKIRVKLNLVNYIHDYKMKFILIESDGCDSFNEETQIKGI